MTDQPWTIDSIAHALPAADTRQTFLREVNLAPLPDLPSVLARWQRFVESWRDHTAPELDALLEYAKTHNGDLPAEYADDGGIADFRDLLRQNTQQRHTDVA